MKVTLFERWRRNGSKQRHNRKPRLRGRQLRLESLEERALLTANSTASFSTYDVNQDGYINVLDAMKVVGYINSHGSTSVSSAASTTAVHSQALAIGSGSSSASNSAAAMDVTGDGFINVLDIIKEIKALDTVAPQMGFTLVPTDASDTPLAGPITVGTTFFIDVNVQDLRDPGLTFLGVASAEADVAFVEQGGGAVGATPVPPTAQNPNPIPTTTYPFPGGAAHGDVTSTPGVLKFIQGGEFLSVDQQTGFQYFQSLGGSVLTLDRVRMIATAPGVVQFDTQLAAGEPNVLASGTGVKDVNDSVTLANNQISLGSTSVTIVPVPPTPATLSGTVYVDANGNNTQDGGESGQGGVTVQLLNSANQVVGTTQTSAVDGSYSFTNIAPGTYSIHEVQPAGLLETGLNVGLVRGSFDGTANGSDTINSVTLASGDAGTRYNFAVQQPASIAGREYIDANDDNVFDAGDTGLAGVTIQLLGPGSTVQTTTTGADGTYSFTSLLPGTYAVHEVQPSGVFEAVANVGTVNGSPSGTASGPDTVTSIALGSGATGAAFNFAVVQPVSISGTEYNDADGDSLFDHGEAGLPGVTIQLLNSSNQVVGTPQITDSNGNYSFTNIPPGTYMIHELQPPSPFVETAANVGTINGVHVGAQAGFDTIAGVALGSGASAVGYDFGVQNHTPSVVKYTLVPTDASDQPITGPIIIGQTFFVDVLVQDLRIVAYAGVASGNVDMAYVAQGGGTAGATPTGNILANTVDYPVPSGAAHGDALSTPGIVLNLQGAEDVSQAGGIGFYQPLGGSPFVLDRVELTATAPGVVAFNTQFSAGENTILASGTGVQNINDTIVVPNAEILPGATQVTIVPAPAALSGTIFIDTNGDNTQQAGEAGVSSVMVELLNSSNAVVGTPQTTDSNGHYSFTNVPAGTYAVHELQPAGLFETGVSVGTVNGTASGTASGLDTISAVTLTSAAAGAGYNFALAAPASLSGTEFVDTNGNNFQDPGEVGLAGITIQLLGAGNSVVTTTTTAANGSYSFTNLAPGTYALQEIAPSAPYFETGSIVGSAGGTKVGFDRISGVTLGSGASALNYNFAVQQFANLSGTEYVDTNGNNTFDAGDTGLPGVTIQLLGASNQVVGTATTASDGSYSMSVMPGTYTVHELPPGGSLVQTTSNVGTAGGSQSGVDSIANVALGSGATATGYNFGVQDHVPFKAEVRLAATQLDGSPLPAVIPGGETFWLYEYVTDLRQPISDALGVLAAYTTVTFDASKFSVVSPLTYGANYQNNELPGGQPGDLKDVGALAGSQGNIPAAIGNQEQLVFQVELQVKAGGTSNIDPGQPDQTPLNPLGIIMYPDPPATDGLPLPTAAIHFIGLDGVQTTNATIATIDSPVSVVDSTTDGALTPMTFTVHLSAPSSVPVTINYATASQAGDTAVAGVDYVAVANGQITIPANTLSATFPLEAIGNSLNEADKTFHVSLSSATNNVVLSPTAATALGVIQSGVALPSISIQPATGTEGGSAVFNVSLSAHSGQVVTVHYQTLPTNPQSAVPGVDYEVQSGDIVFNPSDVSLTQQITVPLPLDAGELSPTQFLVVLSTNVGSNATLANSSVLGTILPLSTGSLSGWVYHDLNGDGIREAGEGGYAGVTILLTGTDLLGRQVSIATQTKADGSYNFGALGQGHYVISEVQPMLFLEGKDMIGTQGGDASVQDQFTIDLAAGVNGAENDFGEGGMDPNRFWWPYF